MESADLVPRALTARLQEALRVFPVVVVTGARQTGKSTLVRELLEGDRRLYVTLDEIDVRDQAERAGDELLRRAPRLTLDEVQRSPDLLLAVKRAVDEGREPGRFILTGSANLLLMERVSESLAGRAAYLELRPLTRREQLGLGTAGVWDRLFEAAVSDWYDVMITDSLESEPWQGLAERGGYPVPAYRMRSPEERQLWFDGYLQTYLERDLRQLAAIEHLADFRRLMRAASLRLGNVLNQADLARDVGLSPSTAKRYVNLMETSFQLVRLEPYAVNRTKRLVKSPKVFWSDSGVAMSIAGERQPRGAHLENIVLNDLLCWRDTRTDRPQVLYWRTDGGAEVDFVIELGDRLLPVEVKSGAKVAYADTKSLRLFMDEYADKADGGLVLYSGNDVFWVADRILAMPWWRML
jgi:predicted AAA+ superfamily ATPase